MIVNCMNINTEEKSLNITNINLFVRFKKTREIFPCVTRILSIFLTTAATSASVERVNSKERVKRSALCSNNPDNVCEARGSGRKDIRR